MKKAWQRCLVFGLVALMLASGALVRPSTAADDKAAQERLSKDTFNAMEVIRSKYVVPVDYEPLAKAAIYGMLRTLDPHSNYFDPKSFAEMNSEHRSQYFGIGALVGSRNRHVFIVEPYKGTPAARAGLRYGDQIVMVDTKNADNWTVPQVANALRGERGTRVRVTVERAGVAEPITVSIERDAVALPAIPSYYLLRPGVGYIGLTRGFHSTTSDELMMVMAELKEQGANSFVLDMRGNPGGFLDQAIKVSEKFIQRGQIVVSVHGREGRYFDRELRAEAGSPETVPLVVLINGGTASASEIVAGAIQDHDRGLIVGENSFGKGLVQHIFNLSGGAGLTLTIARYYTPSGRLIQRDYSNGSFYEYIVKRSAPGDEAAASKPRTDEKFTDLGRPVFGGGGIDPDIKVESSFATTGTQNALYHGLFYFVRELTAGQVAAAPPSFKLKGIEFDHKLKPNEFLITDEILKAYREFMHRFVREHPEFRLTPAQVDDNLPWARLQIRKEVLEAAYGSDTAQRALADLDSQVQRAVAELPNAANLAERARAKRSTVQLK